MGILSVDTENHFNNYYTCSVDPEWSGWFWWTCWFEESERFWMTPDMTKTGAAPGHWGSPSLADTLLRYLIYYLCDSIWVLPSIMGVLFRGVGVVAAMPNISPDQETTSILVGIASCTMSYFCSIRDHYDFVLCHTYGVLPDIPPVLVEFTVLYRLWHYKRC